MTSKKKHILIVSQNFYPESFGINDIVADMVKKGFKVDVLTGLPNYPQGKFFKGYGLFKRGDKYYSGARLYRCVVFPRLRNSSIGISLNYASFASFASLKLLVLMFRKYDKVFAYEPSPLFQAIPALIIAKFKKCEKIIYVLDIWPDSVYSVIDIKYKFFRKWLKRYSANTYKKFDKLLITSRGIKGELVKLGIDEKKIIFLPQWLPKSGKCINYNPLKSEYDTTFNLVFTGNIGVPQNLGMLVDSAIKLKEYKDIRWIIVGDGDYLPAFKKQVKQNELDNIFVFEGRKPFSDIPMYYDIADGLLATLKDIDLFSKLIPAKIQAYMQSGKPILCAINGEGAQVVYDAQCGLVSPAGDVDKLTDNIVKLYNLSKKSREQMGQNGIKYSKDNFNREILLDKLAKILNS